MKKLLFSLLIMASLTFAQSTCVGVSGNTFGVPNSTMCPFDAAYLASQPTVVENALGVKPGSNGFTPLSLTTAYALAAQGYFIDNPIMVWGWDPYLTMLQRSLSGYTTYPDGTGTMTRVTSVNPADYPPFVTPPPPPPVNTNIVGGFNYTNPQGQAIYFGGPGDNLTAYPNGATYTDARGTFTKTAVQNPFGWSTFWTLTNPANAAKKPAVKVKAVVVGKK